MSSISPYRIRRCQRLIATALAFAALASCDTNGGGVARYVDISTASPVTLLAGSTVDLIVDVMCYGAQSASLSWADENDRNLDAPLVDRGVVLPPFPLGRAVDCPEGDDGIGSGSVTIRLYAADDAALGLHRLALQAAASGDRSIASVDVNVIAPIGAGFALSVPPQIVVPPASGTEIPVTVVRAGHAGPIALSWQVLSLAFGTDEILGSGINPVDPIPDAAVSGSVPIDNLPGSSIAGSALPYVLIRAEGGTTDRAALVRLLRNTNAPATPTGFQATPALTSIGLGWNASAIVLAYKLERETVTNVWDVIAADIPGSATSYIDTGRTADTPYSYRLSATNVNGTSPFATLSTRTLPIPPPPPPSGQGWVQLGAAASVGVVEPQPSLLIDHQGRPVVAYREGVGSDPQRLYVKRFEAGVWTQVGTGSVSNSPNDAYSPSLAIDGIGTLYVAWQQNEPVLQNRIYVSRLNGSAWESVVPGGLPVDVAGAPSAQPSLAIGTGDVPIVAWRQGSNVQVRTLQGGQWVPTNGTGVISAPGAYHLHMTVDGSAIAWAEGAGPTSAVKVVRGFDFGALGTSATPSPLVDNVSGFGIVNAFGEPYVVYAEGLSPFSIRTRRWDGTAWADFGTPIINQGEGTLVSIAMDPKQRVVAYSYSCAGASCSSLGVYGFNQTGWSPLTSFLTLVEPLVSRGISVAMATTTSPVVAAGVQVGSTYELRVRRYFP